MGESIGSILENYNVLNELYDECLQDKLMPDVKSRIIGVKSRIIGVKTQMSNFSLLFGLHLSERILKITDNLSKTLQLKYLCAAEAQAIVSHTVKTLMSMRHDEEFLLFWKHMDILRVRMNTNEPVLPTKRKTPRRFEVGDFKYIQSINQET